MFNYKDELVIEVKEIQKMMDLLANLLSIRTSFIYAIDEKQYVTEIAGNNGNYREYCVLIQKEMKDKCIACDRDKFQEANEQKKPLLYQCYNGLFEMFLPLFIDNYLVGYLHFGQVRTEDDFDKIAKKCSLSSHTQLKALEKSYNSMEIIKKEKLVLISELFQTFSDLILKNRFIELRKAKPEYYLKIYIEENYSKPISVRTVADFIKRSPSYVTHMFGKIYGKTFHDYLNAIRIQKAKEILNNHTIDETYMKCGFKNRYHFSKVFKKIEGITPGKYQQLDKKK